MIPPALIAQVNCIRTTFRDGLATLEQAPSFQSLLSGSEYLHTAWREIRDVVDSPRFRRPCDGRIVCAIIGASSHGKTTILDELFPDLARRGWLITEANDTTSQSLRIEYATPASPQAAQIIIHSWGVAQIKKMADAAQEENLAMGIATDYEPDAVILDGSAAKFDPTARKALKFPLRQELRPFPQAYEVSAEEAISTKFIRALTIKDLSDHVERGPVLSVNGSSYDSLQLRAIVKDVTLHESFERVIALSGRQQEPPPVGSFVFIDTPGLGTVGSVKDEVLVHVLAEKSPQIVLQLLEDDELDIVLHLVLCGGQSTFGTLWKFIEKERGRLEIESLVAERLFVVINGTNKLFQDPTLSRKWDALTAEKEGDPFSVTLRDNILEKMVPKGRVRPAGICFVDSIQHVGRGDAGQYKAFYEEQKPTLLDAIRPGGVGYETIKLLGLDQTLAENVEALCDPTDRGQGFLIRQIVRHVEQKGSVIFLKRYLILAELRQLRGLLSRYYDDHGVVRSEAVRETLQECLSFLYLPATANAGYQGAGSSFIGIETFASTHIDAMIDKLPMGETKDTTAAADRRVPQRRFPAHPQRGGPESRVDDAWVGQSFRQMCAILEQAIVSKACAREAIAREFVNFFRARTEYWGRQWGYDSARLSNPMVGPQKTDRLVRHCLKFHCREMLYQLLVGSEAADHTSLQQSTEEKEKLASLIRALDEAIDLSERFCREHAIGVSQ
jgi:hypothetical protein